MAKAILEIMNMSAKGQEYVLSRFNEEHSPIELDGVVYMIPNAVNQLIKELIGQNWDLYNDEKIQDK
jgi:hypothetical protein